MVNDYDFLGVRGLGGKSTSTGVDVIAEGLRELGIKGDVINQEFATTAGVALRQNSDRKHIIFGYSMGASDAIDVAAALVAQGHEVPLLFTMDPAARRNQVDGVGLHINVWQDNPMYGVKPFFKVTHVAGAQGTLNNIMAKEVASHGDLDDTKWVQELFLDKVDELITAKQDLALPLPLPVAAQNTQHSVLKALPVSDARYDSLIDALDQPWSQFMDPNQETDEQRKWQEVFFGTVRKEFGGLTHDGVEGLKSIIFCHRTFWSDSPLSYLAWFMGNIRREVGPNMRPIKETQRNGEEHLSDAQVVSRLNNWWAKGGARRAGVTKKYWLETAGYPFGRGLIQTTWHDNYVETREAVLQITGVDVPFDVDYNLMLDPLASAIGAFAMALKGNFTERALINYLQDDGAFDYRNARRIVNGDTQNFDLIERYCKSFEKALEAAEDAVPSWLANNNDTLKLKVTSPEGPVISPDEIIVTGSFSSDLSQMTEHGLIELIGAAAVQLSHHQGHQITLPSLSQNPSGLQRRRGTAQTEEPDNSGVNPMKNIDGLKTYIVAFAMALIALSEGVLGVDIPGAEMQSNWIEYVLGAAGLGTGRHAIAKLIKAVIG